MLKVVVVGYGSIGKRHVRTIRKAAPDAVIQVCRKHGPIDRQGPPEHGDGWLDSIDACLKFQPDAAVAAGPATTHVQDARAFVERGISVLVEKPLAADESGLDELFAACAKNGATLAVGYVLRRHPVLRELKRRLDAGAIGRVVAARFEVGQWLPDWRPGTDFRRGVSARRELGGGALLELSHEFDYAVWLLGPAQVAAACAARLGDWDLDVEDTAEVVLRQRWEGRDVMTSLHVDMLQREPSRSCKLVGTQGTLEADLIARRVRRFDAESGLADMVEFPKLEDLDQMFVEQFLDFLDCVRTGRRPEVDGESARETLKLVLQAKRSAQASWRTEDLA